MVQTGHSSQPGVLQFRVVVAFVLLISVLSAVPATMVAAMVGTALVFRYGIGYTQGVPRLIWPLVAVFVLGFSGALVNLPRDVMRDIFYAFNPLAIVFTGYFLSSRGVRDGALIRAIIYAGLIAALMHLFHFLIDPALLFASATEIRDQAGPGNALCTLSLVMLWKGNKIRSFGLWPSNSPKYFASIGVLTASLILSFSRTEFVTVIILALVMSGALTRISLRGVAKAVLLVTAVGVLVIVFGGSSTADDSFYAKILRSVAEVTLADYTNAADINTNWRGFEAFQALNGFLNASPVEQIFGRGFGALVDLGFYMTLGASELRYIPTLHNGYAYVLTKFGVVGILLYVYFYISVIAVGMRYSKHENFSVRFFARCMLGACISLVAIMLVVGGLPVATAPSLALLIGYAAGSMRRALGLKHQAL